MTRNALRQSTAICSADTAFLLAAFDPACFWDYPALVGFPDRLEVEPEPLMPDFDFSLGNYENEFPETFFDWAGFVARVAS